MRADVRGLSAHVRVNVETELHIGISHVKYSTHTKWHRSMARGGAPSTLPACGIGSSLEVCAPKVRREVTLWPMSQRVGPAVLSKIL